MKKNNFAFIGMISWTVVLIFLLSILVYGFSTSGSPFYATATSEEATNSAVDLIKEESFSIDDLTSISFNTKFENLMVQITDVDEIVVRQYGTLGIDEEFSSSTNSGKLKVTLPGRDNIENFFNFSFDDSPRLEVHIPEGYNNDVSLETSSGNLIVLGEAVWNDVSTTSTSGNIDMNTIDSKAYTARCSSGGININSVNCKENVEIKATSGDIYIDEINASNIDIQTSSGTIDGQNLFAKTDVNLSSSSGTIDFENIVCEKFDVKTTSGGFSTSELTGSGDIVSSSGSLNIYDFSILGDTNISATSGSINISALSSQNYKLDLETTSGSIDCSTSLKYENDRKNKATGTVGNGSIGTLSISASSGSINID